MRTYELLYIIPATLTDEEVAQTETDILALVQKYGGTTKESRRLGKYKFAYLIKKIRHGYYVLVYFDAEPDVVAKVNEALRIHERVVRHLILRADEAGGDEFNLVQFQEVVVEGGKDDKKRKKVAAAKKSSENVSEDVQVAQELDKTLEDKKESSADEGDGSEIKKEEIKDESQGEESEAVIDQEKVEELKTDGENIEKKPVADVKVNEEKLDKEKPEETKEDVMPELSAEELDKKIDAVLTEDAK